MIKRLFEHIKDIALRDAAERAWAMANERARSGGFFVPHWEKITILAFLGKDGEWFVSKGEPRISISSEIVKLCVGSGHKNGWIAMKREDGKTWVEFDHDFPKSLQQRIQNIISAG